MPKKKQEKLKDMTEDRRASSHDHEHIHEHHGHEHAHSNEDAQKEIQRKYMQLQLSKQQLQAFLEEKMQVEQKLNEMAMTIDALNKISDVKNADEMWSPLGSSTFLRSDIKDVENVLVEVGAGVVLKKKREDAITILQGRFTELSGLNNQLAAEINRFGEQINRIEPELQRMIEKERQ